MYRIVDQYQVYEIQLTDPVGVVRVLVCEECGIPVGRAFTEVHDNWHKKVKVTSNV